ncbi:MAG: type II toxin-antitoxin system VapC family toxin [Gammaproteobacteria bacterium]|nr:type II toxin-antitoxin system VapC family toxin [Gammaproteobacteria bacterium]
MKSLEGKILYIDSNCFIYLFEDHPVFGDIAQRLFLAIEQGACKAVTSTLTLMEVMAGPMKAGEQALANEYADLITTFPNLTLRDMDHHIARRASLFRVTGAQAPDAIHLATAAHHETDGFVTADQRLARIPGVPVLMLNDIAMEA